MLNQSLNNIAVLFCLAFYLVQSKEYLISAEFQKPTITPADVNGWTKNIIRTCEQTNIVEFTGQVFGVFSQDVTLNLKNYTNLPPHWSALVRLDLMLYGSVDSSDGDFAGISLDSYPIDRYTKSDVDGYKICSDSSSWFGTPFNDVVYPYQKNITHTTNFLVVKFDSSFTGKNTDSDYEGYAFKHVSVYVDTCYETCQSCNGPTSTQCITCISGASKVNGVCICNGGKVANNYQCVSTCPLNYVANPTTMICEPNKCLNNCGTCVNQACTSCISPSKILEGECVITCPSYSIDKGTYCEDKIAGLALGGYIFKGLYNSNFGDSEIQGQGLKLVNFKNGGATFSTCQNDRIIGGWNVAGSTSEIRRELPNFKPHWSIRIGFKYIMIDNWASNEGIQVVLDNTQVISTILRSSVSQVGNICGNGNQEARGIFDYNITHVSSSLTITIKNTLSSSKSVSDASFGIREMFVLVNYCADVCSECNAAGCTKCPQGRFLYNNDCGTTCPTNLGYWPNGTTNKCEVCTGNCATCDVSATSCLSCKTGSYLYNKSCLSACPSGYAPNVTTLTCDLCEASCKTCTKPNDATTCQSCQGSLYLTGTQCTLNCPNGTYGEPTNNKCMACDPNCLTCKQKTNADCLSCNSGKLYQPDNNTCGSSCKSTQYINANNCTPCDSTCLTCSGGTSNNCLTCNSTNNRFKSGTQCVTQCPNNFYPDKPSASCLNCHSTCFNCTGPSNNQCIQCTGSLYLNGNVCTSTCPNGQFKNAANNKCEVCDANCVTCDSAKNNCTSCASNQYLDLDGVCKASCPSGKWPNSVTKKCELCDINCLTCDVASKTICTSCNSPQFLDKNTKKCVDSCPSKFYGNSSTLTCDACETTCSECTGPNSNQCSQCSGSLFLETNKCVSSCTLGLFAQSSPNTCISCDLTQCVGCVNSSTNCTNCNSHTFLYNNQCIQTCPDGFYGNTTIRECSPCEATCGTCYGPGSNQCTNCTGGKFFDPVSMQCVDTCNPGYYQNTTNHQCMKCEATCKACTGPSNQDCSECPPNVIFFQNQCIPHCPDSYFKDPNAFLCKNCFSDCFNCTDEQPTSCIKCQGNLYLTPSNECKIACPGGTYANNSDNTCTKCDTSCSTCSGPGFDKCTKCSNNTYLEDNQCKTNCLKGWENPANNQCESCNPQCSKCNGPNDNNCLQCSAGTFLNPLDNTCGTSCPQKYYQNTTTNKCEQCDSTCKNCTDIGADKCTECEGSLFLVDGKSCSSICNVNEFGNALNNKCETCNPKCKTCKDKPDSCTSCNTGTFLISTNCDINCPDGTFKNSTTNQCQQCNTECSTCSGPSKFECNSCPSNTFLNQDTSNCVATCPNKFYADSSSKLCSSCIQNCDTCIDNNTCQKCSGGYYLYYGNCVGTCPDQYFKDTSNQQCTKCYQTCQTCTDATKNGCSTCIASTFKNLDDSSCRYYNECPTDKYADSATSKCEACHSTCAQCTGKNDNQCIECPADKLFYNGQCIKTCLSSSYQFGNKCLDCHPSCASCTGSSQISCSSCPGGQYLQEGRCLNSCILNYYPTIQNGKQVCLECNQKCAKCSGPDANNCTECPANTFKLNNECVDKCPVKYTYDSNNVCQLCTKVIKDNQCIDNCSSNEFIDASNQVCIPCSSGCSTCTGPQSKQCQSCSKGFYLKVSDQECTSSCPDRFFPNQQTNQCEACDAQCNNCSNAGPQSCSSCFKPLILFEGKCLKDAPDGYYKDKDKDQFNKCDKSCKTCDGPSSKDCSTCPDKMYFLDKTCQKECPSKYFNNQKLMECTKCSGQCVNCKSDDYCLSCVNNQYSFQGTCKPSCDNKTQFQDELKKECVMCNSSCKSEGCNGPSENDCIDASISSSDSLIVKILGFKTCLWIISSIIGTILDYKNSKIFGKAGQVRSGTSKLSIHVSDKQVKDLMVKENKDLVKEGTQLNENASPNRRKRNTFIRNSMIKVQPTSDQFSDSKKTASLDALSQELDSPNKKGGNLNFSSANMQSQLQILPQQSIQDFNLSPTSRSPEKSFAANELAEFKLKARPLKKSTIARLGDAVLTFNGIDDGYTSNKILKPDSTGISQDSEQSSPLQKNNRSNENRYPRKLYYTIIGNEIISVFSLYDPERSRLFRAAMIYIKYMILFFMTYLSQQTSYGVAAAGLLAGIVGKGLLQNILSSMGICLRKSGILALIFIFGLVASDLYFWFIPKILSLTYNFDLHWSFLYVLTFTSDFLIIQSFISFLNYVVTVRSKFVNNNTVGNKLLNSFFKQPSLLHKLK